MGYEHLSGPQEQSRESLEHDYDTAIRDNERLRKKVRERDGELDRWRNELADALGIENGVLRMKWGWLVEETARLRNSHDGECALIAERDDAVATAERMADFVESEFDQFTAEQLADVARAKGEDVEADAARVREIFASAYERVTGKKPEGR